MARERFQGQNTICSAGDLGGVDRNRFVVEHDTDAELRALPAPCRGFDQAMESRMNDSYK
jgi:hypothetical protein